MNNKYYLFVYPLVSFFTRINSDGLKVPISVIMPVIKLAGVTSNDGFQHFIPSAAILLSFMWVISRSDRSSMIMLSPLGIWKSMDVIGAAT